MVQPYSELHSDHIYHPVPSFSALSLLYNPWSSISVTQILLDVEPSMGHGQHTTLKKLILPLATALMLAVGILARFMLGLLA